MKTVIYILCLMAMAAQLNAGKLLDRKRRDAVTSPFISLEEPSTDSLKEPTTDSLEKPTTDSLEEPTNSGQSATGELLPEQSVIEQRNQQLGGQSFGNPSLRTTPQGGQSPTGVLNGKLTPGQQSFGQPSFGINFGRLSSTGLSSQGHVSNIVPYSNEQTLFGEQNIGQPSAQQPLFEQYPQFGGQLFSGLTSYGQPSLGQETHENQLPKQSVTRQRNQQFGKQLFGNPSLGEAPQGRQFPTNVPNGQQTPGQQSFEQPSSGINFGRPSFTGLSSQKQGSNGVPYSNQQTLFGGQNLGQPLSGQYPQLGGQLFPGVTFYEQPLLGQRAYGNQLFAGLPTQQNLNELLQSLFFGGQQYGKPSIGGAPQGRHFLAGVLNGQLSSGQNGQLSAGQNGQLPSGQNGQLSAGQNSQLPSGQNGQLPSGQNGQLSAGQNGQLLAGQNGQLPSRQNSQLSAGQNSQLSSEQDGQLSSEHDGQLSSEQNGQLPFGQNGQLLAGQNGQLSAGQNSQLSA